MKMASWLPLSAALPGIIIIKMIDFNMISTQNERIKNTLSLQNTEISQDLQREQAKYDLN